MSVPLKVRKSILKIINETIMAIVTLPAIETIMVIVITLVIETVIYGYCDYISH